MIRHIATMLTLVACSGAPAGRAAPPIVDFVDSTPLDAAVYSDLAAGDTIGHFVYAFDPTSGAKPLLYGTTYWNAGGAIVQRWRQSGYWPGADTIWVWEGITLAGSGRWTARTIVKFVPTDPEWGLAIESNPTVCSPRIGATWERLPLIPLAYVGSAFSHIVRR